MTKEELEQYIEAGLSGRAIALRTKKSYSTIRYWLAKHDLKTHKAETVAWDIEQIKYLATTASSKREVLFLLGLRDTGSIYTQLNKIAKEHNIVFNKYVRKGKFNKELKAMFCNPSNTKGSTLRKHMVESFGMLYECSRCHLTEWLGETITLEVEHIDGNHNNNVITNLCFLCPNCHALTPTHSRKKTFPEKKEKIYLCKCGNRRDYSANQCKECYNGSIHTKINWPSKAELNELVQANGYSATGRLLGVSDNAVRKRLSK